MSSVKIKVMVYKQCQLTTAKEKKEKNVDGSNYSTYNNKLLSFENDENYTFVNIIPSAITIANA